MILQSQLSSIINITKMVKVYLAYQFAQVLGQAISRNCNFVYDNNQKLFITGVNQYIALISAKNGQVEHYLYKKEKNVPVRVVYLFANKIYAGYQDGEIQVWSLHSREQLFVFDLHKTTVSSICISEEESKLISAGFDGNIMIWDLISEECQAIKSAHLSMITQVLVANTVVGGKPTNVILTVGKDGFFKVWNIKNGVCLASISCQVTQAYCMHLDQYRNIVYIGTNKQEIVMIALADEDDDENGNTVCRIRGVFKKKSFARCAQIFVDHSVMYVFNADRTVELYKMLTAKEVEVRKKRVISRRKKAEQQQIQQPEQAEMELKFIEEKVIPFKFYNGHVIDSRIFLNNGTNIYELGTNKQLTHGIGRTYQLCLMYPFVVQRSGSAISIYVSNTMTKLFTIPRKAEWCCLFTTNFLLVVGQHNIEIWNLLTNQEVCRVQEKWVGGYVRKNKCLLWRQNQLGIYQIGYNKKKQVKIKKIDNTKFEDKIIQCRYKNSMDKYIVNLQNSQIFVNYADSHKNFLKLYAHKLPILSFDLTSDDTLLSTGSLDKDIRIWDMDFGHSIKSLFAHQQAVTIVRFIPQTHYLLSGSKDGFIKFWDMDTYQLIMNFQENTMEVKALAVSQSGDLIVGGGLDEGLRVWKQTNEQTIASDLEEKQNEKIMIEDYAKQKLGERENKTRYQDLKHGQQIIQALQNKQSPKALISLIKKISPGNLKSCLSFLHERHVRRLEQYIEIMIDGNYEQETCWRVIRDLNRGSQLGKKMREVWRPVQKLVHVNTQILKTLLKHIQEQNSIIQ